MNQLIKRDDFTESEWQKRWTVSTIMSAIVFILSIGFCAASFYQASYADKYLGLFDQYDNGALFSALGAFAVVIGAVFACATAFGFRARHYEWYAEKGKRGNNLTILTGVTFASSVVLFVAVVTCASKLDESLNAGISKSIQRYSFDKDIRNGIDAFQIEYQCCADRNFTDWFKIDWQPSEESETQTAVAKFAKSVPESCCNLYMRPCVSSIDPNENAAVEDTRSLASLTVYQKGCMNEGRKIYALALILLLIPLAIILVLEFFVVFLNFFSVRWASKRDDEESEHLLDSQDEKESIGTIDSKSKLNKEKDSKSPSKNKVNSTNSDLNKRKSKILPKNIIIDSKNTKDIQKSSNNVKKNLIDEKVKKKNKKDKNNKNVGKKYKNIDDDIDSKESNDKSEDENTSNNSKDTEKISRTAKDLKDQSKNNKLKKRIIANYQSADISDDENTSNNSKDEIAISRTAKYSKNQNINKNLKNILISNYRSRDKSDDENTSNNSRDPKENLRTVRKLNKSNKKTIRVAKQNLNNLKTSHKFDDNFHLKNQGDSEISKNEHLADKESQVEMTEKIKKRQNIKSIIKSPRQISSLKDDKRFNDKIEDIKNPLYKKSVKITTPIKELQDLEQENDDQTMLIDNVKNSKVVKDFMKLIDNQLSEYEADFMQFANQNTSKEISKYDNKEVVASKEGTKQIKCINNDSNGKDTFYKNNEKVQQKGWARPSRQYHDKLIQEKKFMKESVSIQNNPSKNNTVRSTNNEKSNYIRSTIAEDNTVRKTNKAMNNTLTSANAVKNNAVRCAYSSKDNTISSDDLKMVNIRNSRIRTKSLRKRKDLDKLLGSANRGKNSNSTSLSFIDQAENSSYENGEDNNVGRNYDNDDGTDEDDQFGGDDDEHNDTNCDDDDDNSRDEECDEMDDDDDDNMTYEICNVQETNSRDDDTVNNEDSEKSFSRDCVDDNDYNDDDFAYDNDDEDAVEDYDDDDDYVVNEALKNVSF